ncbi:MAG: hypothetical protein LBW85_04710 [Deltaproteobacteria bacterium]|nr:hypothetical protein [Deltaproteobacteria bacterium]
MRFPMPPLKIALLFGARAFYGRRLGEARPAPDPRGGLLSPADRDKDPVFEPRPVTASSGPVSAGAADKPGAGEGDKPPACGGSAGGRIKATGTIAAIVKPLTSPGLRPHFRHTAAAPGAWANLPGEETAALHSLPRRRPVTVVCGSRREADRRR